jgi:hypothetical protein
MRQILETERIKAVVKQVMQETGFFDLLKKLGLKPPEPPKRPTLRVVKDTRPPIGK